MKRSLSRGWLVIVSVLVLGILGFPVSRKAYAQTAGAVANARCYNTCVANMWYTGNHGPSSSTNPYWRMVQQTCHEKCYRD
jgi:hypothetical protein